ncbi:DNA repair protein RecO [Thermodesulfobacteriota bacterium]
MPSLSSPAILLRRIDHGDYDLIITFFTLYHGKMSSMAKAAKKSMKRFSGILELFSVLDIVCNSGRGRGLAILQEASLKEPFSGIRADLRKTAYASYWVELVNEWMEDSVKDAQVYNLLLHVLGNLNSNLFSEEFLSIVFQMKFIKIVGISPNLRQCNTCGTDLEKIANEKVCLDPARGGLLCEKCSTGTSKRCRLSKGTVKQLLWIENGNLDLVGRIRFSPRAAREALGFLETFVPYHMGKKLRSLKVLRQLKTDGGFC